MLNNKPLPSYFNNLNKEQLNAVSSDLNKPLMISAGPGTGKTTVLTCRIVYNILKGTLPESILALTFTRKSAEEMSQRVKEMLNISVSRKITICTIHQLCHRILRETRNMRSGQKYLNVVNTKEQRSILLECHRQYELEKKKRSQVQPLNFLTVTNSTTTKNNNDQTSSGSRNNNNPNTANTSRKRTSILIGQPLSAPEQETKKQSDSSIVQQLENFIQWAKSHQLQPKDFDERYSYIYSNYEKKLKLKRLIDFSDFSLLAIQLFQNNKIALNKYRKKFRTVLVDEFQDTNVIQFELIKMLVPNRNDRKGGYFNSKITVVGDLDQSIYGFRGAETKNFQNFLNYYIESNLINLEQNYRSSKVILKASTSLISFNSHGKFNQKKVLWTKNANGDKIVLIRGSNKMDEAVRVANEIQKLKNHRNFQYSDIALLFRIRDNANQFEKIFTQKYIPFTWKKYSQKDGLLHSNAKNNNNDNNNGTNKNNHNNSKNNNFQNIENNNKKEMYLLTQKFISTLKLIININNEKCVRSSIQLLTNDEPSEKSWKIIRNYSEKNKFSFFNSCLKIIYNNNNNNKTQQSNESKTKNKGKWLSTKKLNVNSAISPNDRELIKNFLTIILQLRQSLKQKLNPFLLIEQIFIKTNLYTKIPQMKDTIQRILKNKKQKKQTNQIKNPLILLIKEAISFDDQPKKSNLDPKINLRNFLKIIYQKKKFTKKDHNNFSNNTENDNGPLRNNDNNSIDNNNNTIRSNIPNQVIMSTIHQAKGLEFPIVFIVCFNEGNLPLPPRFSKENFQINNNGRKLNYNTIDLQEERRIAMVAMTRAKVKLYLSFSQQDRYNKTKSPSQFLGQIAEDCIKLSDENINHMPNNNNNNNNSNNNGKQNTSILKQTERLTFKKFISNEKFNQRQLQQEQRQLKEFRLEQQKERSLALQKKNSFSLKSRNVPFQNESNFFQQASTLQPKVHHQRTRNHKMTKLNSKNFKNIKNNSQTKRNTNNSIRNTIKPQHVKKKPNQLKFINSGQNATINKKDIFSISKQTNSAQKLKSNTFNKKFKPFQKTNNNYSQKNSLKPKLFNYNNSKNTQKTTKKRRFITKPPCRNYNSDSFSNSILSNRKYIKNHLLFTEKTDYDDYENFQNKRFEY
ncbi:DNA helicase ii [Anaeramoeba flamelloides]|uniref:DNA 3'-5' helicase n=1 Tax=Anaeramoeba flamelloides TaxID=1746091 RepID=A0ABQ8X4F1_9EUKA|nr:DNA helicase ii [Anaeramoeba flamelloides]